MVNLILKFINKKMKSLFKTLTPLFLVAATFVSACSAYSSKADTKENIIGLYELEIYSSKHEKSDEETYDRKADEGIEAYFTIDMDGYGYYGYKDNNTPAKVEAVFSTFVEDDEKPGLFKAINLKGTDQTVYYWDKKVGCLDEPTMGFKMTNGKATLSYTLFWQEYEMYNPPKIQKYQYVCYKKISNETGYDAINRLLGTSYAPDRPYEMKYMKPGYYPYRCESKEGTGIGPKGIYEYALLDMNNFENNKLKIIYSEIANPGQKSLVVDVSIKEIGRSVSFTLNNKEFVSSSSAFITAFDEEADIKSESFTMWYSSDLSLEEVIAQELDF